jgi:hypothetical protein
VTRALPGDGERLVQLAHEMGERLGSVVRDVIPPDAQHHLLNAQRELLTALVLIYEHQAGSRRSTTRRRSAARRPTRPRVTRIKIE